MIFEGCKGENTEKTDRSTQQARFNLSFCYFRDSKFVSLFITNKKNREKTQKIPYFLPKYFADTEKIRIFAVHLRNEDAYLTHRNPLYHNASFFDLFTFSAIKSILYICALVSYHITYYV